MAAGGCCWQDGTHRRPSGVLPESPPPRPWREREWFIRSHPHSTAGETYTPSSARLGRAIRGEGHERKRTAQEAKMSASPSARAGREGGVPRPASESNETCGATEHARPAAAEGRSGSELRAFLSARGKDDPVGASPARHSELRGR